jgi:hypothetical protein
MNHQMRPSAKVLAAAALALLLGTQAGFSASGDRQSCSGVLTHDQDGYLLTPDADAKSSWCSAYIGDDEKSALAKRVLKTCPVGSHCHIEGLFLGHGIFYWTKISTVSLLKR